MYLARNPDDSTAVHYSNASQQAVSPESGHVRLYRVHIRGLLQREVKCRLQAAAHHLGCTHALVCPPPEQCSLLAVSADQAPLWHQCIACQAGTPGASEVIMLKRAPVPSKHSLPSRCSRHVSSHYAEKCTLHVTVLTIAIKKSLKSWVTSLSHVVSCPGLLSCCSHSSIAAPTMTKQTISTSSGEAQSVVILLTGLPDKVVPSIVLEGHKSALVEVCRCVVPPGAARPMAGKIKEWRGTVNIVKCHHLLHRWIVKAHYVV